MKVFSSVIFFKKKIFSGLSFSTYSKNVKMVKAILKLENILQDVLVSFDYLLFQVFLVFTRTILISLCVFLQLIIFFQVAGYCNLLLHRKDCSLEINIYTLRNFSYFNTLFIFKIIFDISILIKYEKIIL